MVLVKYGDKNTDTYEQSSYSSWLFLTYIKEPSLGSRRILCIYYTEFALWVNTHYKGVKNLYRIQFSSLQRF